MDQQYIQRLEKIEAVLERWLPENPGPAWAEEVFPRLFTQEKRGGGLGINLLQTLLAPGSDLLSRGGKRWRPLLMTLVCEALGGGDAALPLAPLVEFSHNASLIHDDIEDNSDERRGKPAAHIVHGVDAAINGGSFLYFLSPACIDSWTGSLGGQASAKAQAYALWADHLRRLHLGQAIDIHWHRNYNLIPSVEEYYIMCALKTGCLAGFAAKLGVAAAGMAGAGLELAERLGGAAEKLGVGFQILDDVKNLTSGIPGKKRGDDVVEGKKSLPVILFLRSRPEKKETVSRCFSAARLGGVSAPEVEELIQALLSAGVLAQAGEKGRALIAEARDVFTASDALSAEGRALLAGLIDLIS